MKEFKKPQKMLGPSQVSTVLGYNQFDTIDELRKRMENGYVREIKKNITAGLNDEPRCRSLYEKEYNTHVDRCPFVKDPDCRFGGCGDGLVGMDGGLEIKCQYQLGLHDPVIYFDHKIQAVAYMFLYKRQWWDIMVAKINKDVDSVQVVVERLYWSSYSDIWNNKWYPLIKDFCRSIKWSHIEKLRP